VIVTQKTATAIPPPYCHLIPSSTSTCSTSFCEREKVSLSGSKLGARSTHVEGSRRSYQTSTHGEVDNVPDDVREPMAADGVAELAREGVEVDLAERRELSDRRATRAHKGSQRTALKRKEIVSPKTARANSLQGNGRRLAPARRKELGEGRREASMRPRDRS